MRQHLALLAYLANVCEELFYVQEAGMMMGMGMMGMPPAFDGHGAGHDGRAPAPRHYGPAHASWRCAAYHMQDAECCMLQTSVHPFA